MIYSYFICGQFWAIVYGYTISILHMFYIFYIFWCILKIVIFALHILIWFLPACMATSHWQPVFQGCSSKYKVEATVFANRQTCARAHAHITRTHTLHTHPHITRTLTSHMHITHAHITHTHTSPTHITRTQWHCWWLCYLRLFMLLCVCLFPWYFVFAYLTWGTAYEAVIEWERV